MSRGALLTSREARRRLARWAGLAACLLVPTVVLAGLSIRSILGGAEARRVVLAETYQQVADFVASNLSARLLDSERYLVEELAAGSPDVDELMRRVAEWGRQDERLRPLGVLSPGGDLMQPLGDDDSSLATLIATRRTDGAGQPLALDTMVIHGDLSAGAPASAAPAAVQRSSSSDCQCEANRQQVSWALERRLDTIVCQINNKQFAFARSSAVGVLRNLVYNRFELDQRVYDEYYPRVNELLAGMPLDAATRAALSELRAEAERRDAMVSLLDNLRRAPEFDRRLQQADVDILRLADRPREALVVAELPGMQARVVHRLGAGSLAALLDEVLSDDSPWADAGVALVDDTGQRLGGPMAEVPVDAALAAISPIPEWSVAAFPRSGSLEELARDELRHSVLLVAAALLAFCVGAVFAGRGLHRELALSRMRSDFVASVSHELKTPLTLLSASAENLRAGWVPDERRDECYEAMGRETQRLTDLVENVLSFRRIESGARTYRFALTDLRDLVDEVRCRYRTQLEAKRIDLEVGYPDEPVLACVDRDGVLQVLVNLLSNAVKHMPNGSRHARIELRQDDGHVSIAVVDSGIGIPQQEIGRIFEPFFRGTRSVSGAIAGSGIGLAIVRHIVEAHRGEVVVESTPGRGSVFTVRLPRQSGGASSKHGP